jgi:hypothetical protein
MSMPSVRRHIHIDAPPDVVRPFLDDPALRRGWLDEEVELARGNDGVRRFSDDRGEIGRHVGIRVDPEGDGSRVTVTESLGDEPDDTLEPVSDDEVVALHDRPGRHAWYDERWSVGAHPDEEAELEDVGHRFDDLRPTLLAA